MTIVINQIADVAVESNAGDSTLNLSSNFDDPLTTGLVASFQLENTALGDGAIDIILFDQPGSGAPQTVNNFLNYSNRGAYINSIVHRSVRNFVVQGGGYTVDNRQVSKIPADPPVLNEFSPARSNLRGTIAMAKLGDDPNSATNEWFFNLNNNSGNLDSQNGGFTVFGQVRSSLDLATIDAIAAVPIYNVGGAFREIPLLVEPNSVDSDDDFVRFKDITVSDLPELQFTVIDNSNPNLVNAAIVNDGQLLLNYLPDRVGTAEITIGATNLLGETVQDTFTVTVSDFPFDPAQYGASYLDLIRAFGYNLDALGQHYFNIGRLEGRSTDLFDEKAYLASYDDLLNIYGTNVQAATEHYIRSGAVEGRSITFNPSQYLASYNDLILAFGNNPDAAEEHFITSGWHEGRSRDTFPEDIYLASYGDLIQAFGYNLEAATQHYLNSGAIVEGRQKDLFNPMAYLSKYPDLQAAFGDDPTAATRHYIEHGYGEGRTWV